MSILTLTFTLQLELSNKILNAMQISNWHFDSFMVQSRRKVRCFSGSWLLDSIKRLDIVANVTLQRPCHWPQPQRQMYACMCVILSMHVHKSSCWHNCQKCSYYSTGGNEQRGTSYHPHAEKLQIKDCQHLWLTWFIFSDWPSSPWMKSMSVTL